MNTDLKLNALFDAVYLINGSFVENGKVTVRSDEVTYVTVLPLSAVLLPYTVRLYGDRISSNEDLCHVVKKTPNELVISLRPRYNYVYTPTEGFTPPRSFIGKFFKYVKCGSFGAARTHLTAALSADVTDEGLAAFFDGYDELIEGENGECFLSGKGKTATLKFSLVGSKIDDVVEE